jgi:DnaJ family protein C protein 22
VDRDDQEIKCRDAAKNFFSSPFWKEFSIVLTDLWRYAQHHGWSGLWRELVNALDPQGEGNALKTLSLPPNASQEEITIQYKKLARQWHPDRHKLEDAKKAAQEKFIEIQQAYETLSKIKDKRLRRNRRERDNPTGPSSREHQDL